MIICESPLAPVILKQMIARLLFDYFQVPSISFVPIHLMALLTTGLTTGLVIDVGNLETSVLPVSSIIAVARIYAKDWNSDLCA